ncbi:MAG: hypothetical protein EPN21_13865 [Methylococcaceae bacterium]|nr:MAG: hypothetical protein EPN21_13865 [Methylococcaceae bacterium]
MHTTQLTLEDWQYEVLRTQAESEQRSIADIVGEILARQLAGNSELAKQRLMAMEGIGTDASACGRDHDAFLYGAR